MYTTTLIERVPVAREPVETVMEFRKILNLSGPNIWARTPMLEAWVDLGTGPAPTVACWADLAEQLLAWLPGLASRQRDDSTPIVLAAKNGANPASGTLAELLQHVALELHTLSGWPVSQGRTLLTTEPGVYRVIVEHDEDTLARSCLETARRVVLAARDNLPLDIRSEIKQLHEIADMYCLGPSTRAIVNAAQARQIPVRRLTRNSLVQLGQGCRQRRIRTAETDVTGAVAESIASDKQLTKTLLRAVGVPVPEGRPVETAEDAWQAAQEFGAGVPVVVKPRDGNHGRGVFTALTAREQVEAAFHHAAKEGEGVLVERFAQGSEHRLLVVGNRVVAAARGDAAQVVGDGANTVAALIELQINSDPRRGTDDDDLPLARIELDPTTIFILKEQGFDPESVPPVGKLVLVQHKGNLATDVTDLVHPEVEARAVEAARVVGLDIAGLDVVAIDIGRPLEPQGGVIVEVNAGPGLQMHLEPSIGQPRPVGTAIVDLIFPPGETGVIPVVGVTGTYGSALATRLLVHLLQGTYQHVGNTVGSDALVNQRRIRTGDTCGARNARHLLLNPVVDAAVFEVGHASVLQRGLGFEHCDVAVVTAIDERPRIAKNGCQSIEELLLAKRTLIESVEPCGVAILPAADREAVAMAPYCQGEVVFFAAEPQHPQVAAHLSAGRRAAIVRDAHIVLLAPGQEEQRVALPHLLAVHRADSQPLAITLSAVTAAWALDLPLESIAERLLSFDG